MKRATITISDDVEAALEVYRRDLEVASPLMAIAEAALRQYLAERGYLESKKALHITPVERGSGIQDTSIKHDRYLGDG